MPVVPKYPSEERMSGASESVISDLGGGLNSYLSPISIQPSQMSSIMNMYTKDGVSLRTVPYNSTTPNLNTTPLMYAYFGHLYPLPLLYSKADSRAKFCGALDISSLNFDVWEEQEATYFVRAADSYHVYGGARAEILLVKNGGTVANCVKQAVPKYVDSLAAHCNRIFILSGHFLFWSAIGTYNTWYGSTMGETDMLLDAGHCFVASESQPKKIVPFRDALYIFCDNEIWILTGGKPEEFRLVRVVSGIGTTGFHPKVAQSRGRMYFVDDEVVYEYNGVDMPNPISRPEIMNGQITNGVMGGINPKYGYMTDVGFPANCFADDDNLYVFNKYGSTHVNIDGPLYTIWLWVYQFDLARRVWTRRKHFVYSSSTSLIEWYPEWFACFDNASDSGRVRWAVNFYEGGWRSRSYDVNMQTAATAAAYEASIVTKAFAPNPSQNLTISDIFITWRSENAAMAPTIYAYLSDKESPTTPNVQPATPNRDVDWTNTANWTLMKSVVAYNATEEMETLRIQIPHSSAMSMKSFFRLGLRMIGCDVSIHRIELRYRAKGVVR